MPADPQPSQEPGPRNQLIPPSARSAYDERYGIGLHAKSLNPAPMAQGASTAAFHCKSGTSASRPKRLLRQPGGFEGLFTGQVLAAARDLPVADGEDRPVGLVRF